MSQYQYPAGQLYHGCQPAVYHNYKNGLPTAAMVLGIIGVSLFWIPFFGVAIALVGLGLSIGAMVAVFRSRKSDAKGRAISGPATSIVGTLLGAWITIAVSYWANEFDEYVDCRERANTSVEYEECDWRYTEDKLAHDPNGSGFNTEFSRAIGS